MRYWQLTQLNPMKLFVDSSYNLPFNRRAQQRPCWVPAALRASAPGQCD
jgi:hypothetical protein